MTESPFKKAWDRWLDSKTGQDCANVESLKPGNIGSRTYMENRLHRAFSAGWAAAETARQGQQK